MIRSPLTFDQNCYLLVWALKINNKYYFYLQKRLESIAKGVVMVDMYNFVRFDTVNGHTV